MTKNQLYKNYIANGGRLSFAEWMQENLRNSVQQAMAESDFVRFDCGKCEYANADGATAAPDPNSVPTTPIDNSNTVFGMNKSLVYGIVAIVGIYAIYKVYVHYNKEK